MMEDVASASRAEQRPGVEMAERENKKSLKSRAQDLLQGVVEAIESLFPSARPQLVPVRATSRPRPRIPHRRR
jgi:hypothetical protein